MVHERRSSSAVSTSTSSASRRTRCNCFLKFKDYHKSGADTLYQIARCYEAMGDLPHAIQFYNVVTGYEGHPLYWDAKESLKRLGKD